MEFVEKNLNLYLQEETKPEFDLNKVYTKIMSKEKLIEIIKRSYDKEFVVVFLPRTKSNSDILIRSRGENEKIYS